MCLVDEVQLDQYFPNCVLRVFKIFNTYTSFQSKLTECCHKVKVNDVGDRGMLLEKVVISEKTKNRSAPISLSPVMLFTININRFMCLVCGRYTAKFV